MICENCGNEFELKKHGRRDVRFCSDKCCSAWYRSNVLASRPKKYTRVCECCGQSYQTNYENQKYCSNECRFEARRKYEESRKKEPRPKRHTKECEHCGKTYQTNSKKQKYCSAECRIAASRTGRTLHEKTCLFCGTVFQTIDKK